MTYQILADDTIHAHYHPETGVYGSAQYPQLHIPSHLTIDQFLFSSSTSSHLPTSPPSHPRPNPTAQTWLIDSVTEKRYTYETCQDRSTQLATAFSAHLQLSDPQDVLAIYAPNDLDYPIVIWAAFKTGAIVSGANPTYTPQELAFQLEMLNKHHHLKGLITHPDSLKTSLQAAKIVGLPTHKIIIMSSILDHQAPPGTPLGILTLEGLLLKYSSLPPLPAITLGPTGAEDKVAFLSFSSGTTGLPKAVQISHRAVIANMMMIERHMDEDVSGERVLGVLPYYHICRI